ncbi:MAG TPA: acetate--CoA ligase family protein, partial [Candidatus Binatus sp.]|nr:acetate--CoA ligase family protein [Candidatus Binatus sp.]
MTASPTRRQRRAPATPPATGAAGASSTATPAMGAGGPGPQPSLQILETRVYRGPNTWAHAQAIRMLVDLGVLEDWPSNTIPGFVEALVGLMPSLEDHACSLNRRGGFISRLHDGTWAGHVAEHVALELQNLAGTPVRIGKTRGAGKRGRYNVIFEYREETVGLEAGRMAVRLVNHLVAPADPDQAFDFEVELEHLIRIAERQAFGPSTQAILDEAASRDIPFIRLDRHSLVQLGQGVYQQRIRATMTSRTSGIAIDVASDKNLTNRLLDSAGLPVPKSSVVTTEDGAAAAAREIGFPCVLKPLDGNHGRGVQLDLRSEGEVRRAFAPALAESRAGDVVVETFIAGNDYRCLVIGGRVAAIAERVPAGVTGDGRHTVAELVERTNADPRRGIGHEKVLTRIAINEAAIELVRSQGLEMTDVPRKGQRV